MSAIDTPSLKAHIVNLIPDRLIYLYLRYSPLQLFKTGLARNLRRREHYHDATTAFGARMIDLRTCDAIQGRIYMFGIWEPNLTSFLAARLRNAEGRLFIDVGANVGYFTLLAGLTMLSGKVMAIEALPANYKRLQNNLRQNTLAVTVEPQCCAISDHSGSIDIYPAGKLNDGASTTVAGIVDSTPVQVPCVPLHSLVDDAWAARVRLIKIDVEGAEYQVIKGMLPLLAKLPADAELIVELTPDRMSDQQQDEIFDIFGAHGFHAYEIPNRYAFTEYVSPTIDRQFQRIQRIGERQTDILFTRHDGASVSY